MMGTARHKCRDIANLLKCRVDSIPRALHGTSPPCILHNKIDTQQMAEFEAADEAAHL